MGLPDLYSPPEGDEGWKEFWFDHYQDHLHIIQTIFAQTGVQLTNYLIDPWLDSDKDGILERHQQYHNDMNRVLGIPGNDLSELNFEKGNEVKAWVWLQYQEHSQAHSLLNI